MKNIILGTKKFGRTESEQNDRKLKKTTIFEDSGLKASEISGDIVKWLVYDSLEDKVMRTYPNDFIQLVFATFVVGSISAVSGSFIKDFGRGIEKEINDAKLKKETKINNVIVVKNKKIRKGSIVDEKRKAKNKAELLLENKNKSRNISTTFIQKDNNPFIRAVIFRYCTSAIEGGVLFASYQIVTKIVTMIVPENYNVKFVFNQVLQEMEREIDPDVV